MKKLVIIILCVGFYSLLSTHIVQASETSLSLKKLNDVADDVLTFTQNEQYNKAKQLVQFVGKELDTQAKLTSTLTPENKQLLEIEQQQALNSLNNETNPQSEKLHDVTTFRLLVDALNSKYQPLWMNTETTVMSSWEKLHQQVDNDNDGQYQSALNTFLSEYSMIQPSLTVSLPNQLVQSLAAEISYLDKNRGKLDDAVNRQSALQQIEKDLQSAFHHTDKDQADASLWWIIISTGSVILITLFYVGFRKYLGEKENKKRSKAD